MSAYLESTSAVLGEYMLKGWTMTDLVCRHCRTTPLMREPTAQATAAGRSDAQRVQFCGRCDGSPEGSSSSAPAAAVAPTSAPVPVSFAEAPASVPAPAPVAEAGPSAADRAANDISSLLLQGYSLLGTNCPAPTCRGIPLVGYPKGKDGKRDPRKRCVGCGQGYIDEKDAGTQALPSTSAAAEETMSPRSKRRRELYAEGEKTNQAVAAAAKLASAPAVAVSTSRPVADLDDLDVDMAEFEPSGKNSKPAAGLSATQAALERTLARLSESLDRHADKLGSGNNTSLFFVDLKLHTEAINDICKTIRTVRETQDLL